jgi:ketosteroid isomerase-like protein
MAATPIETINSLIAARNSHDYAAAFDCYADGALVVLQPGENSTGEEAIKVFIKGASALILSFEGHQVLEAGDVALHTSQYTVDLGENGKVSRRTADVLKRDVQDEWKIVIDNAFAG